MCAFGDKLRSDEKPAFSPVLLYHSQGTNAHAILSASPSPSKQSVAAAAVPWQRRRLWFAPPQHVLLQRAMCHGSAVQLAALLSRAHLACMWDHRVCSRRTPPPPPPNQPCTCLHP